MAKKPFIDPEVIEQLAGTPAKQCAVIITCDDLEGKMIDRIPPIPGAKPILYLPGVFTAKIDSCALRKLSGSKDIVSVELDREQHILD